MVSQEAEDAATSPAIKQLWCKLWNTALSVSVQPCDCGAACRAQLSPSAAPNWERKAGGDTWDAHISFQGTHLRPSAGFGLDVPWHGQRGVQSRAHA